MKHAHYFWTSLFIAVVSFGSSALAKDFDYLPSSRGELVQHSYYSLSYIEDHELSEWVAHKLTPQMVNGRTRRRDNFRPDPLVTTNTVSARAYRGSGFDRGHMAPAGDMKLNRNSMSESFFMSNMAPQDPGLNRGIWRILEERIRKWVKDSGTVYVISGPILHNGLRQLPPENVSIPDQFYKIVLDLRAKKMIAFIFSNRGYHEPLTNFVVSVDYVEQLSNIDFFPALPDELEDRLERYSDPDQWDL